MCLSLSFSNTRVHARDRNAHRDAGGCRRFQDSSPSRSTLPGRKQRRVTPIDTDSLGPRSGFLRVTSRCTFPCSFCSRPRLRPHGRGRRFTQPRGRGRGVGAPRFVGPDPFAPRVLNVLCVSVSNAACVCGCHGCTHRRGGSTLRHRTQRLLWPGGSDPKLVCREPSRPAPLGPPAAWRSSLQPRVQPQCCREPLPGGTLLRLAFKPLGRRRLSILPWSLTFNILIVSCLRVIFLSLILLGVL